MAEHRFPTCCDSARGGAVAWIDETLEGETSRLAFVGWAALCLILDEDERYSIATRVLYCPYCGAKLADPPE